MRYSSTPKSVPNNANDKNRTLFGVGHLWDFGACFTGLGQSTVTTNEHPIVRQDKMDPTHPIKTDPTKRIFINQ